MAEKPGCPASPQPPAPPAARGRARPTDWPRRAPPPPLKRGPRPAPAALRQAAIPAFFAARLLTPRLPNPRLPSPRLPPRR
jgi:hypothetical protein